jgi:hypothetical protein
MATDEKVTEEAATPDEVVAARSADVSAKSSSDHIKVFVLPPGPKPIESNGYDHEANKAATLQYMLSLGLRPTGEVEHVSTKQHANGVSWELTYKVPAQPAEDEAEGTVTRVLEPGETAEVNTDGAGHSQDTTAKAKG